MVAFEFLVRSIETGDQVLVMGWIVVAVVVLLLQAPWVMDSLFMLCEGRRKEATGPQLVIEYDKNKHFDVTNQTISFDVRAQSEQHDRVHHVHVYIERLTPKSKKRHPHQLAVQFTNHELAQTREERGFRLDGEQAKTIKFAWSSADDENIHFSGYTDKGELRELGFDTVKAEYEAHIIATSRNAITGRARFQIGHTKDGSLIFKRLDA